jgi:hypothetical protein
MSLPHPDVEAAIEAAVQAAIQAGRAALADQPFRLDVTIDDVERFVGAALRSVLMPPSADPAPAADPADAPVPDPAPAETQADPVPADPPAPSPADQPPPAA